MTVQYFRRDTRDSPAERVQKTTLYCCSTNRHESIQYGFVLNISVKFRSENQYNMYIYKTANNKYITFSRFNRILVSRVYFILLLPNAVPLTSYIN